MQSKKIVRPIICLFTFSMLLAACAGPPAQPTPATAVPATPIPTLTAAEMPAATPEAIGADEFMGRQNPVGQLIWSADGKTLVAGANSGLYTLNTQTDAAARPLENAQGYLSPLALDRQGVRLLAGSRVWDMATGKVLYQIASNNVTSADFSPDGRTLAVGESNSITLWDADTGKFQKSIGVGLGSQAVFGLAFTPGGSQLYVNYADGKVRRADVASGQFTELFSLPQKTFTTLYSANALQMLINRYGDEERRELWDVADGKMLFASQICINDVSLSAFSMDGKYFIMGPCHFDAQLWDIQGAQIIHLFPSHSPDNYFPEWRSAAFSPDGRQLALGNDIGEVLVWDLSDYRLLRTLDIPKTTP